MQIFGYMEKEGRMLERPFLTGSWSERIVAHMPNGSQWTLFEVNPLPGGPNRYFRTCPGMALMSLAAQQSSPTLQGLASITNLRAASAGTLCPFCVDVHLALRSFRTLR